MMHFVGIVPDSDRREDITEECVNKEYVIKEKSFNHGHASGKDRKDVVRPCDNQPIKGKTIERIQGYYGRCGHFSRQRKMLICISVKSRMEKQVPEC
jgi:hypothetical protein